MFCWFLKILLGYEEALWPKNWREVMPVKLWQTIVRFWFSLSYLITTVFVRLLIWLEFDSRIILDFSCFHNCSQQIVRALGLKSETPVYSSCYSGVLFWLLQSMCFFSWSFEMAITPKFRLMFPFQASKWSRVLGERDTQSIQNWTQNMIL